MTDDISAWGEAPEPDDDDTADTFDLGGFDAGDQMPDAGDLAADEGFGPADTFADTPDDLPDDSAADDGTGDDGTGDDGTGDDGTVAATFEEPLDDASDSVPDAGLGPAHNPADATVDGGPDAESTVGADPDAEPYADGTWPGPEFPAALDLVPPVPVDGFPWADPQTLGQAAALPDPDALTDGATDPADLAADLSAYLGGGAADWAGLIASDDPATAALARFWAPPAG